MIRWQAQGQPLPYGHGSDSAAKVQAQPLLYGRGSVAAARSPLPSRDREGAVAAPFAVFGLLLAVVVLSGCRDNRAVPVESASLTIECDGGAPCVLKPDHLESWPKKIVVISRETWDCQIVAGGERQACSAPMKLPASTQAWLELRASADANRVVRLPVIDQNLGQHGVALPIVSLSTTLLALLLAGWVAYLSWDSSASGRRHAMDLDASIRDLERTIHGMADMLAFPDAPEPRAPAGPEPAPVPRETEALRAEIGKFVQYLKDCFVGLGNVPDETGNKIREMERLHGQIGRQTDTKAARAQYRTLGKTLVRLALRATDDDFSKHKKRNPAAETALGSLLDIAGYSLLAPKPLEKYSDRLHVSRSRSEPAESRNQRGCIARVERRGLLDSNHEVIEKAEVVLYD